MARLKSITHVEYIAFQEADNVFNIELVDRSFTHFGDLAAPRQVQEAASRPHVLGPGPKPGFRVCSRAPEPALLGHSELAKRYLTQLSYKKALLPNLKLSADYQESMPLRQCVRSDCPPVPRAYAE
jgi:hypothetical protein